VIAPNNLDARAAEIRDFFMEGKIVYALKRLMDFISDFSEERDYRNEVTVISANYNNIEKLERRKQLKFQKAQKERNTLLYQALDLLDMVADTSYQQAA
jgi:hypothetical protein